MPQFGAGQELASQCPRVAAPTGWRAWHDGDGPIPAVLQQQADAMANNPDIPLGSTASVPLAGVTAMVRVEPRTWARDQSGEFATGCYRVAGVYLPADGFSTVVPPTPQPDKLSKTVGVLTVASLVVGIATTVAGWTRK